MRWRLADEEVGGQSALFGVDDLLGPQRGTGKLTGLEFLHVATRKIINPMPPQSNLPFRHTINVYRGCSHACTYCFARPTHEYLGLNLGEDFDRKIVVKINAVERIRAELRAPSWAGEPIAMGTNTDPYQRCEGKYRLTRGVVEALTEHRNPFSILTKSALVVRDLDLISEAARHTDVNVSFSIATLDERVWRATEPGTPHPRRRIEAMGQFAEAGIRTGALVAPVLPGLSDSPEQLAEVSDAIRAAGGHVMSVFPLYLRPKVKAHFMAWLAGFDPQLHADYERRYRDRTHAPETYIDRLRTLVRADHQGFGPPPGVDPRTGHLTAAVDDRTPQGVSPDRNGKVES
jgi:DNA repair photolyase